MKPPNPDNPIRNTLKHLALGVAAAAAFFTSGPSANANVTYDFTTGVQGWTPVLFDTAGDPMWGNWGDWNWLAGDAGHLQNVWGAKNTGLLRSPEFLLNGTGDLTFQMLGTPGLLSTPVSNATPPVALRPSEIPATAYVGPANGQGGGFAGVGLRDVAADTYVLSKAHPGTLWIDHPVWTNLAFTAAELAPYMNNGKKYTLDFIDYDKSPDGEGAWLIMRNVSIPSKHTSSEITAFGTNVVGSSAVIDNTTATEGTVEWAVPFGTPLASLAPTFTLSSFATCNKTSGVIPTPNFSTGQLHYIVTAEDGISTRDYTVTVTVDPPSSACEITAFGTNVAGSFASIINDETTGTVEWIVPGGTDLASLAPTFTLSLGATCNQPNGAVPTPNFSSGSSTYDVTAKDGSTKRKYTVTVRALASPPVTSGMIVWLPADGVSTSDPNQVRIDGTDTFVKQWSDRSGGNKHATNGTDGDQPLYIASGLNGKPALRFAQDNDDNGDRLYLGDLSALFPTAASVFIVSTIDNDGRYNLFGNRGNNDERWVANTWNEAVPGSFRNSRTPFAFSSFPQNGSHVFALQNSSGGQFQMLVDGASIGTASADYNSGAGSNWTIGNRSTAGQQLRGDIAEVILYDRVLSTVEADQVGAYLATKYSLSTSYGPPVSTGSLPADNGTMLAASDLSMAFNKSIAIVDGGTITIKNLTDTTQTVITLPDPQVSVSGAVLTINPTADLLAGKSYAVQISPTAITDLGGTPFPGIPNDTTWNFTIGSPSVPSSPPLPGDIVVWLPADGVDMGDSTQVRFDNGGNMVVKKWNDLIGTNQYASNTTENDQPRYVSSGLNSKPVLRFAQDNDDNGDRLYLGDLSASFPDAASVFIVSTIDNDGRYNLFGNRNNDERWVADSWNEAKPGSFRGGRSDAFSYASLPQTGSHVFALENSTGGQFKFLIDGASIGTDNGDYNSGAGQNWTIGNRATNGQQLRGDIAEVILYNRVLTPAEAEQVGTYLETKYALTTAYGPPAVSDYSPEDNGTTAVTSNLALTFTKPIAIGTGNITIKNLSKPTQTVIPVDDPQVSVSGSVLTINPTADLVLGDNYAVQIAAGAVQDLAGNPFAGILNDTTWNFATVAAITPPAPPPVTDGMIVWLPADGVNPNDSSQVRTEGGNTLVKRWNDLSGNANHATQTTGGDQPMYITDGMDGKPVLRFDGGSDKMNLADLSLSFPTAASMFIVTTLGNDNAYTLVKANPGVDEWWRYDGNGKSYPGAFRGGRIEEYCAMPTSGSHVFSISSSASAWEMLINGASQGVSGGNYNAGGALVIGNGSSGGGLNGDIAEVILYNRVLTPPEADKVGVYLAGKYGLTTTYGLAPSVVTYVPADDSTMSAGSDLVLTFNMPIAIGTGKITIKNLSQSTQATIEITDDTQVSISGAVLTINPTNDLALGKNFAVQIDAGAIKALSDVPYAGISDDTTWNFATAPPIATTTVVTSSGSPTTYGDSVTFTAKISPTPSGGTVQFYNGFDYLGTPVAVDTTTGEAAYITTKLGAGTHGITAEYSGNHQFAGSTTSVSAAQTVNKAELTVKATNVFRPRNTANPDPLPYQITGYKNGENLASSGVMGTPDLSTTAVLESPVGDYPITCTVIDLLAADNYSFKSVNGVLTVADVEDTFSVNFYYDGTDPVRIQSGVAAGLAGWYTPGWYNQSVPWGGGLQAPVTLSSNMASTSTFIFKDCRNGGGTQDPQRTTNLEDGTYSLMAAMAHGTSRITEEPNKVDIEMTNIPFGTYDVIFYMGRNPYHGGDGTGVIVFNDAPERAFTVKSGAFDGTFTEMVDGTTPGNYIVYPGVTGSSFTVQIYGNDFNHLGPTGFQIRKVPGPPYSTWAATNAPGQAPDQDYDNDGVENGIEYFMGETGSSFTAMPGLDATNKVSWTMDPDFEGTYEVQTSPDLGTWTNVVPKPMPSGGKLSYTLPTDEPGGKSFVRLLVTPTP